MPQDEKLEYLNGSRAVLQGMIADLENSIGVKPAWPVTHHLLKAYEEMGKIARAVAELREKKARQEITI